jgi:hypothetical protein
MIKNIHTLIGDIYDVVESEEGWLTAANVEGLTGELGRQLVQSSGQKDSGAVLRLSQMGEKCPCQLWHSVHTPSLGEKFTAPTLIKFTYGHVIEALVISMAKAAGHEVTGEQDVLYLDGVKGHRDCVIDGCVVDVKSTNSLSFKTIKSGNVAEDPFLATYLAQLDGYVVASADDPVVRVKDRGYLLAVDKTLGHMCLYEHKIRPDFIRNRIRAYQEIVDKEASPACTCGTVADGESGNYKLGLRESYNPFKFQCAERRGEKLRTFLYEGGPRFLTKVVRRPKRRDGSLVPEVDMDGKTVYN